MKEVDEKSFTELKEDLRVINKHFKKALQCKSEEFEAKLVGCQQRIIKCDEYLLKVNTVLSSQNNKSKSLKLQLKAVVYFETKSMKQIDLNKAKRIV